MVDGWMDGVASDGAGDLRSRGFGSLVSGSAAQLVASFVGLSLLVAFCFFWEGEGSGGGEGGGWWLVVGWWWPWFGFGSGCFTVYTPPSPSLCGLHGDGDGPVSSSAAAAQTPSLTHLQLMPAVRDMRNEHVRGLCFPCFFSFFSHPFLSFFLRPLDGLFCFSPLLTQTSANRRNTEGGRKEERTGYGRTEQWRGAVARHQQRRYREATAGVGVGSAGTMELIRSVLWRLGLVLSGGFTVLLHGQRPGYSFVVILAGWLTCAGRRVRLASGGMCGVWGGGGAGGVGGRGREGEGGR